MASVRGGKETSDLNSHAVTVSPTHSALIRHEFKEGGGNFGVFNELLSYEPRRHIDPLR